MPFEADRHESSFFYVERVSSTCLGQYHFVHRHFARHRFVSGLGADPFSSLSLDGSLLLPFACSVETAETQLRKSANPNQIVPPSQSIDLRQSCFYIHAAAYRPGKGLIPLHDHGRTDARTDETTSTTMTTNPDKGKGPHGSGNPVAMTSGPKPPIATKAPLPRGPAPPLLPHKKSKQAANKAKADFKVQPQIYGGPPKSGAWNALEAARRAKRAQVKNACGGLFG